MSVLQQTREQWQVVFFIISGCLTFGIIFFGIFGRGEVQEWALEPIDSNIDEAETPEAVKMLEANGPSSDRGEEAIKV